MDFVNYFESKQVPKGAKYNMVMVGINKFITKTSQRYYIEESELDEFYFWCNNFLKANDEHYINFAQVLNKVSPLALDFDIVVEYSDVYKKQESLYNEKYSTIHIYNENDIVNIVSILNNIIYDNFEISKSDIKAYILEKQKYKIKNDKELKDGLHIIYNIPFNPTHRWFIRSELIKEMEKQGIFKKYNPVNSYDDIVDDAVIERNPWLTYGSVKAIMKKDKLEISMPYKLTMILNYNCFNEYLENLTIEELMPMFNMCQYSDNDEIKTKREIKYIHETNKKLNIKQSNNKSLISQNNNYNSNSNRSMSLFNRNKTNKQANQNYVVSNKLSYDDFVELVDILIQSEELYTKYKEWFRISCCLCVVGRRHGLSDNKIKMLVYKFSSQDPNFDDEMFESKDWPHLLKCAETYRYFSIENLYVYANAIDEKRTKAIKNRVCRDSFKKIFKFNADKDVAEHLYNLCGGSMVCINPKTKEWLYFPTVNEAYRKAEEYNTERKMIWDSSINGQCLSEKINDLYNEVVNYYEKTMNEIKDRYLQSQGDFTSSTESPDKSESESETTNKKRRKRKDFTLEDIEMMEKLKNDPMLKRIWQMVKKLGDNNPRSGILNVCGTRFYNRSIVEKMNENKNVICFNNGYYDLTDMTFKDPDPLIYSSFTTGFDYEDYSDDERIMEFPLINDNNKIIKKTCGEIKQEISDYMKTIFTDEDDELYMWKFCASLLSGQITDESFYIWTGKGSNGKSLFNDFLKNSLGDYYSTASASLLVMKRNASNAASPEIANKKGRRVIVINEPEETDIIYAGKMKELTGGDSIEARGLYQEPITFKPQFRIVMICNNKPNISGLDNGTWRRIKVIEFSSTFGRTQNIKSKKFYINKNVKTMITNKIWCQCFVWMLLNKYYDKFKEEGLNLTPSMVKNQNDYKYLCDDFIEYIESNYILIDPEHLTQEEPYYEKDTPENKRTDIIYWDEFYENYKTWYNDHKSTKRNMREWKNIKDYLEKQTNCKVYKDEDMEEFIIGLKRRIKKNKKHNTKQEEDGESVF